MTFEMMRELERNGKIEVKRFRGDLDGCDTQVSAFMLDGVYWLLIHRRVRGLGMSRNGFGFKHYNIPLVDNRFMSFESKEEANKYYMRKLGFCKRVKQFDVWKIGDTEVEIG